MGFNIGHMIDSFEQNKDFFLVEQIEMYNKMFSLTDEEIKSTIIYELTILKNRILKCKDDQERYRYDLCLYWIIFRHYINYTSCNYIPLSWLKIAAIMSEILIPYEERINKMLNVLS